MPRKRVGSKKKGGKLNNGQFWNLLLDKNRTIDERRGHFKSALTRRAAWYEHRGNILPSFVLSHPGRRPGAWWAYEAKEQPEVGVDDWEVLLRLKVMDEAEMAAVLAQWVDLLQTKESFIHSTYDNYQRGIGPYHGDPSWDKLLVTYDRQSSLLGEVAASAWLDIKSRICSD